MKLPANLPQKVFLLPFKRAEWSIEPPPGHTLAHVLDPDYWVHALQDGQIQPRHKIEVLAEDFSFYAVLLVIDVDENRMWAKVKPAAVYWNNAETEEVAESKDADGFRVHWAGPHDKWRILSPMGIVVSKGHGSRGEAEEALIEIKTQKAA